MLHPGRAPEEFVETLIDGGANVNSVSSGNYWTPLELVPLKYRRTHLLKYLIDRGAKVNPNDLTRNAPLVISLQMGDAAQTRMLLDYGADPGHIGNDNDGWPGNNRQTCMGWAAGSGSSECLRLLAAFGAPITKEDGEGHDARAIAAKSHPDLVPLLNEMASKEVAGWNAAHFAAAYGYADALKVLKSRGVSIDQADTLGVTPLMVAAYKGNAETCEELVRLGADVKKHDLQGDTCLHEAALSGSVATASLLLGYGASPDAINFRGQTPQAVAAENHSEDVLRVLANASKTTAFIAKAEGPEAPDTKLKKAIESKQEDEAVRILDANPNLASERYGKLWTPLHYAAYYGEARLAEALIAKSSPIEARTDTGWTPLMMAAQQGSTGVVKALLEAKADPNLQTKSGRTALHVAAQENRSGCIELLRKFGAKRNLKDSEGLTALQIAVQLGNSDAAKALRS